MPFPTVAFDAVSHVGSLDKKDKGVRGTSWEGHGLSISLDPQRWVEIAKLGGMPWHTLSREDAHFVNAHKLTKKQRLQVQEWGVEHGLVEVSSTFLLCFFDDELDSKVFMNCDTYEEALSEAECMELDEKAVSTTTTLRSSKKMNKLTGQPQNDDAFDVLLTMYVDALLPEIEGVWWQDKDGPMSAPRGVILPSRLPGWTIDEYGIDSHL